MAYSKGVELYETLLHWFAEMDIDDPDTNFDRYGREFRCLSLCQKHGVEFYREWEDTEYEKAVIGQRDGLNFMYFIAMMM